MKIKLISFAIIVFLFFLISTHLIAEEKSINSHILNCLKPMEHDLYVKQFVCPIGGEKFESLSLGSNSGIGRPLDWRPLADMGFAPPLPVCPSNGFVIAKSNYSDAELASIKNIILTPEYKSLFSEIHASYYLYAVLNENLNAKAVDQWWVLLQATREANQCKYAGKYNFYAKEAIKAGKLALNKLGAEDSDYWALTVIIPNLYRRLGDFDSAQAWLDNLGDKLPLEDQAYYKLAFRLVRDAVAKKNVFSIQIRVRNE